MRHKILMHFIVETRDDHDAAEISKKLQGLLEKPLARMAIQSEGIQIARKPGQPDGQPVVYVPTREP